MPVGGARSPTQLLGVLIHHPDPRAGSMILACNSGSAQVQTLEPGALYVARACAVNAHGSSPYGEPGEGGAGRAHPGNRAWGSLEGVGMDRP